MVRMLAAKSFWIVLFSMFMLSSPDAGAAKQRYANDQCPPMRRGSDETFKIVRFLPGGTPVEVVESGENGWFSVRALGTEGWVHERYLTDELPPRQQLESEKAARLKAEETITQLKGEMQTLQEQLANHTKMAEELQHIKQVSGNALAMEKENHHLQQTLAQVRHELELLSDEKKSIEMSADIRFFLTGAGVLILGFVGGASLTGKRRRSDVL